MLTVSISSKCCADVHFLYTGSHVYVTMVTDGNVMIFISVKQYYWTKINHAFAVFG